jgi:hypothetical protein
MILSKNILGVTIDMLSCRNYISLHQGRSVSILITVGHLFCCLFFWMLLFVLSFGIGTLTLIILDLLGRNLIDIKIGDWIAVVCGDLKDVTLKCWNRKGRKFGNHLPPSWKNLYIQHLPGCGSSFPSAAYSAEVEAPQTKRRRHHMNGHSPPPPHHHHQDNVCRCHSNVHRAFSPLIQVLLSLLNSTINCFVAA